MEGSPWASIPIARFESRAGCAKHAGAVEQSRLHLRPTARADCLPRFALARALVMFTDPGGSHRPGSIPGRVAALACSPSPLARRCARRPSQRARARHQPACASATRSLPPPVASRARDTARARGVTSPPPSSSLAAHARRRAAEATNPPFEPPTRARAAALACAAPLTCTRCPLVARERRGRALRRPPAWRGVSGIGSDALCACAHA